jgi:hypothetical protein
VWRDCSFRGFLCRACLWCRGCGALAGVADMSNSHITDTFLVGLLQSAPGLVTLHADHCQGLHGPEISHGALEVRQGLLCTWRCVACVPRKEEDGSSARIHVWLCVSRVLVQELTLHGCPFLRYPKFKKCLALRTLKLSRCLLSNEALVALFQDGGVPNITTFAISECHEVRACPGSRAVHACVCVCVCVCGGGKHGWVWEGVGGGSVTFKARFGGCVCP